MANKVGSGVFPGIKERFKKFRGILNTNPKTAPIVSSHLTPEEKIQALAAAVYGTSSEYATRQSLVEGLKAKEIAFSSNPTDALKDEIETEREQLKLFDEAITKLKRAAVAEKAAEENKVYKAVNDSEKMVDACAADFDKNIATLLGNIEKDEKTNIHIMVQAITRNITEYKVRLKSLDEKIEELKDYSGKDDYVSNHKTIHLSEEQVEKIYRGLRTQIIDLTQMGFGLNGVSFNRKKYIREYEEFFLLLPKLLGNPEKFKAIKGKVDAELKIEPKSDELIEEVKEKIDIKLTELFEQYKAEIKNFEITIDKMRIMAEIGTIVDDYDTLTKKQKEKLIEDGIKDFKKKVNAEYSPELRTAIKIVADIIDRINGLAEIEYTDPSFKEEYKQLIVEINANRDSDVFKKIGAVIILDETNQKVHFIFKNDKVNDKTLDIVPEDIKKQMKSSKVDPVKEAITKATQKLETVLKYLLDSRINFETTAKIEFETALEEFTVIPADKKNELVTEYLDKFNKLNKQPEKTIEEKIEEVLNKLFEKFKENFKKLENNIGIAQISVEVANILDDYDELSSDEKVALIEKANNSFKAKIVAEYGEELLKATGIALDSKAKIKELSKIEYTDSAFKTKYHELINMLIKERDSETFAKIGGTITIDEENQIVRFAFNSEKVNDLSLNIVSEKVKEQMQAKPTPVTEPQTQAPTNDEQKEAIAAYLELLDELKEEITKLNYCNSNIEAAASVEFDNIDADKANTVTAMEKIAMLHDTNILQKKLELSNARANLRIKYNCYVSSIPEINNYEMPSIEFGKDYKSFVKYYDKMITIAETKTKELDKERMADYTPLDRANDLTDEMKKIVNYIEAVNSLINRRIIAASLEENIDIVAFLQERRKNKKVIRQEIKEMLERQLASRPKVNQEEAEQQLTTALKDIYDKWLEQFKLSLSSNTIVTDDVEFENRINEVITKSPANRKYEIAENYKKQFKQSKEVLLLEHYDKITQFEISELLGEQIIPVMTEIRNGAEYDKNNLETLCINQETQEKLNAIMARSQSAKKLDILSAEKSNYLTTIQNIVDKEQIISRRALDKSIQEIQDQVESLEINDDLLLHVKAKYEALKTKYKILINHLEINYDIENNNKLTIRYAYKKFSGKLFGNELARIDLKAMSPEKYAEYLKYQNAKGQKSTPETEPEKDLQTQSELDIKVNNSKSLKFNSANPQHVQKLQGKILTADSIQLTLLKNGLKIKYSENLRNQLKELNARLSLVNKNNYRNRTTTAVDSNAEEQIVTFKKKGLEINPEDYKIEIRTDKYNKNGIKVNGSELLYSMDIDEELAEELRPKKM